MWVPWKALIVIDLIKRLMLCKFKQLFETEFIDPIKNFSHRLRHDEKYALQSFFPSRKIRLAKQKTNKSIDDPSFSWSHNLNSFYIFTSLKIKRRSSRKWGLIFNFVDINREIERSNSRVVSSYVCTNFTSNGPKKTFPSSADDCEYFNRKTDTA